MNNCENGIVVPPLTEDFCKGKKISTACVIHPTLMAFLELPANSTQETINNAFLTSLISLSNRVTALEAQIIILEDLIPS